jgi:3-hydroxyacyl-CoA dehydrogenase/enoyl-CoA hydratase/3-hydroxybutyryl-CoA epimerase
VTNFKYEADQDGIALITWDMPGRSMNVLNAEVLSELESLLDKTTADAAIKGVVVTTGKDTFSGGADLTVLQKLNSQFEQVRKSQGEEAAARIFFEESRKASVLYRKIETCGKPWACAIRGSAVGYGWFPIAWWTGLFQGRDDDLPGRQRDLPTRDLRQLPGGARHSTGRVRGLAGAV